ncbi:MAG: glycoside hydrolase family 15 protein [Gammaproteobacteria bacterium]|nr:glycoside hydrolase family 15 protein [Gammaproteobacteria bacterium]
MKRRHTYEMGIIGNCAYLAYVEKNSNICWMCWPRFDSSFIFGGLLDYDKGGEFAVIPATPILSSTQYYFENTNILCTEIVAEDGKYRVIDFAPRYQTGCGYHKPLKLVRKIERIEGNPRIKVLCVPKDNYGRLSAKAHRGDGAICFTGPQEKLYLRSNIAIDYILESQPFRLLEDSYVSLSWGQLDHEDIAESYQRTRDYWWHWVATCALPSVYQKQVIRSCLALKLHQYESTGAMIAAGSTSLPESLGSSRNWDYRYFWVRDSYYTLEVFRRVGHFEELSQYAGFIRNLIDEDITKIQPLYSITGLRELTELTLPLAGYLNETPVRMGNAAYTQRQYDVFGQIILSLSPLYLDRRISPPQRLQDLQLIEHLLTGIDQYLGKPDAGIWELRGSEDAHLYTALFHWAGSTKALEIGLFFDHQPLVIKAKALVKRAAKAVEACYAKSIGCYGVSKHRKDMDATALQLINMGYLVDDKISQEQIKQVEAVLDPSGCGLLMRYGYQDDFGMPEVAFLICSFWYVSALIKVGQLDKACIIFEELLNCGNHLGLLSEDVSFDDRSQWGNFVQTYSHVGLVLAAFDIDLAKRCQRPHD